MSTWRFVPRFSLIIVIFLSSSLAQTLPASKPDFSKEGVVFEQIVTKLKFENDGTDTRSMNVRVRIQSEAGVKALGLLAFSYQSAFQDLVVDYVRVTKADNSTVVTPADSMQDIASEITRVAPVYSDLRQRHIAVKGLSVGDVLEYSVRWVTKKALVAGQFWYDHNFSDDSIVLDEQLEIRVPRQRPVKVESLKLSPTTFEDGTYRVYTWKTSNLKTKSGSGGNSEIILQRTRGRLPTSDVKISSFQSWDDIGKWYWSLQGDRIEPTPEIRSKAAELTKNLTDEKDKIQAIYRFVSAQVRYIAIDFGIGRYQPHPAAEVLGNQYGDCKDKHTLFASLLRAAGIKSQAVLISSSHEVDVDVPSPSQFDHVISAVPQKNELVWLDTTPEVAPFGFLVTALRDKRSLVISDDGSAKLVFTPAEPTKRGLTTFKIEAKLNDAGTLEGKVDRESSGDEVEVLFRQLFRSVALPQWKDLVQQISYQSGFGGDVSEVTASAPESTQEAFHFSYLYTRKTYSDWENRRISPPLPPMELPPEKDKEKPSAAPIWLGMPGEFQFQSSVELPRDYRTETPAAIDIVRDYAEYHASYEYKDGTLKARRTLVIKLKQVPEAEEGDYKTFRKAVTDDHDNYLTLVSTRTPIDVPPDEVNPVVAMQTEFAKLSASTNLQAAELENRARYSMQMQDIKGAMFSLERAVELDPRFARGWLTLAQLYSATGREEASENAFRKAIAADPQKPALYLAMGSNLLSKRKFEEAAAVWKEMTTNIPDNVEGYAALATTLMQLEQHDEAVTAFESAVRLKPRRSSLYIGLGTAYLAAGSDDKGVEALKKAVELDPTPRAMNDAAYALARANKRLPDAIKFAESAVRQEENTSQKVQLASLQPDDLRFARTLSACWDTLGWIYYQAGELGKAADYVRAAWLLSQRPVIADHLGQVYEKQEKKDAALHMYELALASSSFGAGAKEDEIRERMERLSSESGPVLSHPSRSEGELTELRTAKLPLTDQSEGTADFFLLFGPESRIEDVKFITGSDKLEPRSKDLSALKFDSFFPSGSTARIVRRGVLTCHAASGCSLELLPLQDSISMTIK